MSLYIEKEEGKELVFKQKEWLNNWIKTFAKDGKEVCLICKHVGSEHWCSMFGCTNGCNYEYDKDNFGELENE